MNQGTYLHQYIPLKSFYIALVQKCQNVCLPAVVETKMCCFFVLFFLFFLSAGVENGHVSTNSALRMLFRFMFRVMLQCLLRKPMVLQHIENLNAVSVVRGTPPRNRVAVATRILIPKKEVLCIHTSTFPSSCYTSCPVYFSLLHPCLLFIYHLHIGME